MPPKKKTDATTITKTELRTMKMNVRAGVKVHITAQCAEQKRKQLECIQKLDETYEYLKREPQDSVGVNQTINAIVEASINAHEATIDNETPDMLSDGKLAAEMSEAIKFCEKANVLLASVSKTLEEANALLRVCKPT